MMNLQTYFVSYVISVGSVDIKMYFIFYYGTNKSEVYYVYMFVFKYKIFYFNFEIEEWFLETPKNEKHSLFFCSF